jgi:hypothetical protein
MDFTLNVTENPNGSAYIWSVSGGVMATFETWANAEAVWNLIGVGAP